MSTNISENPVKTTESIKIKSKKCVQCMKKLKLISFDCKCGLKGLCTGCMNPCSHECSVNYLSLHKDRLTKDNPVVIAEKMIKC